MEKEKEEMKDEEKQEAPKQGDTHICSSSCPIHHPGKGALD